MAKSKAKSAGPTGKAKAKAKQAAPSPGPPMAASPSASEAAVASRSVSPDRPLKSRRIERRDTEDQVDRLVSVRLKPYRIETINGVVNSEGEHIRPYLARHIRVARSAGSGKYLSSKFWTQFFKEFDLKSHGIGQLPPPPQDEEINELILKALKVAHSDNPAQRSVEPIERLLETIPKPNYTEFFGLIAASQEAPTMSRATALRMTIAILGLVARLLLQ